MSPESRLSGSLSFPDWMNARRRIHRPLHPRLDREQAQRQHPEEDARQRNDFLSLSIVACANRSSVVDDPSLVFDLGSYPFLRGDKYGASLVMRGTDTERLRAILEEVKAALGAAFTAVFGPWAPISWANWLWPIERIWNRT